MGRRIIFIRCHKHRFCGKREICYSYRKQLRPQGKFKMSLLLEFLLYYMTKPEYQLQVREEIYLDNMLDLF